MTEPAPSRRALLRRGVAASGAALLGVAPVAARAAPRTDLDQLQRLLRFERRLEAAYAAALDRGSIEPGLGRMLLAHEREHVRGLEQALRARGGRPAETDEPQRPPRRALAGRRAFADYALRVEGQAVAAYIEVVATARDGRLRLPLGAIMACGAQHAVALRQQAGKDLLVG